MNTESRFDIVIIGGGITGAGIFYEAVKKGLTALLVDQKDFAWGTSSRSSKLVHGGLRYLKQGQVKMTWDSVREREYLKQKYPGLIYNQDFLMPIYQNRSPGKSSLRLGLSIYDLIAGKWNHCFLKPDSFHDMEKTMNQKDLKGGFLFSDAGTDDARLVLRLLFDAVKMGGTACNYTSATHIQRKPSGYVRAVVLKNHETGETNEIETHAVINATGVWAGNLNRNSSKYEIRPLKGSHLVFPAHILPLKRAISVIHHKDKRPVFLVPWEGAVLLGTTDMDYSDSLSEEPKISSEETRYLMDALHQVFPDSGISKSDIISSFSGLRPVLGSGKENASEETRDHAVWDDKGFISVTGGKLTLFRKIACQVLKKTKPYLNKKLTSQGPDSTGIGTLTDMERTLTLSPAVFQRLTGRYGMAFKTMIKTNHSEDFSPVPGTDTLWAELIHASAQEQVCHLDDLLLRRVRIGYILKEGALPIIDMIKKKCQPHLSWSQNKWDNEISRYTHYINQYIQVK